MLKLTRNMEIYFSYNVTYLAIGMTPFHAFYGYDCFIPLWTTTFTSKVRNVNQILISNTPKI